MQQSDADDVVQNVLCTLARKFVEFQYDPSKGSFRGWLRKLVYHAWSDVAQARGRAGRGTGDSDVIGMLNRVEVRDDLVQRLEAEYDMERLEMAKQRVRVRVEPHTWAAFECTAIEGLSGADTAIKLGMKVANIYVARSSVQRMLKDEIDKLE